MWLVNVDLDTNIAASLARPEVAAFETDLTATGREALVGIAPWGGFGEFVPAACASPINLLEGSVLPVAREAQTCPFQLST